MGIHSGAAACNAAAALAGGPWLARAGRCHHGASAHLDPSADRARRHLRRYELSVVSYPFLARFGHPAEFSSKVLVDALPAEYGRPVGRAEPLDVERVPNELETVPQRPGHAAFFISAAVVVDDAAVPQSGGDEKVGIQLEQHLLHVANFAHGGLDAEVLVGNAEGIERANGGLDAELRRNLFSEGQALDASVQAAESYMRRETEALKTCDTADLLAGRVRFGAGPAEGIENGGK